MEQVRMRSLDAYPTTLPSPRMVGAVVEPSSGFRKSMNPIYADVNSSSTTVISDAADPQQAAAANDGGSRRSSNSSHVALVRSAAPPYIPAVEEDYSPAQGGTQRNAAAGGNAIAISSPHADPSPYVDFEYF